MIRIPRCILKRFRTLCRRSGLHKFRANGGPLITVTGGSDGYALHAASPDVCIRYSDPSPCDADSYCLPFDALEVCEGREEDVVTLEVTSGDRVLLSWIERGVPRQHPIEQPKPNNSAFPELPTDFTANSPAMWTALRDAVATTDPDATRYALGCVHVRGRLGQMDAADGKHILTHGGFRFGFDDDVLIPGTAVLGCRDLDVGESVEVGKSGQWVGFRIANTLILVRAQEGRFPKIDDIIPAAEAASSRLEFSASDAKFLLDVLPSLPCSDPAHRPLTFDLNGETLIRSEDEQRTRPTQVKLTTSQLVGEPVLLNSDRRYVERALRLGFRTAYLYGPDKPVLCASDDRRYLWALLAKESAIQPTDDAVRIESSASAVAIANRRQSTQESSMNTAKHQATAPATEVKSQDVPPFKRKRTRPSASPLEQTVALRDALHNAARQAGDLVRSLRDQKRQARIVETTLASLKQLQKVAA